MECGWGDASIRFQTGGSECFQRSESQAPLSLMIGLKKTLRGTSSWRHEAIPEIMDPQGR